MDEKEKNLNETLETEEIELPKYEDDLNTSLAIDEINDLSENDIMLLLQKIDIEVEQYEDIYMKGEEEGLTIEEMNDKGFNETEYNRLLELSKALYKNLKALRKMKKDNSFFAVIPLWCIFMFVVVALLTMYPVSPFLPTKLLGVVSGIITKLFTDYRAGAIVFIVIYHVLFIIIEVVSLLFLRKKCKKTNQGFKSVKNFLILIIINVIIMIPALIILFTAV